MNKSKIFVLDTANESLILKISPTNLKKLSWFYNLYLYTLVKKERKKGTSPIKKFGKTNIGVFLFSLKENAKKTWYLFKRPPMNPTNFIFHLFS